MSEASSPELKQLAKNHISKVFELLEDGKQNEALKELEIVEDIAWKAKTGDILLFVLAIKADLMVVLGAHEEALNIYKIYLKIDDDTFFKFLGDEIYRSILQMNLDDVFNLGCIFYNMGCFLQAENCFEINLFISRKILKKDPRNVAYQSSLALTLNSLGVLLSDMGRIDEAKDKYEKAIEIKQNLIKVDSKNVTYLSDLSLILNNLGNLLYNMGHIEEAKDNYEKSLDIYEDLLKEDSENISYQSDVGGILNNLGNLLSYLGHIDEAKERYEKALEIREKLLNAEPENVTYQSDVSMTLNNLGNLLWKMWLVDQAKEKYEKSLEIYENLLKINPNNISYQSDIGGILNNLGNLLSDMGCFEKAKKSYEKALEVRRILLNIDPDNVTYQSEISVTFSNLGTLFSDMGRFEEAKQKCKNALDIYENLLHGDPENLVYKSNVSMTLNNLGISLRNMGYIEEAKKRYEEALDIYEDLLKIDPENVSYQSGLSMPLNNLGTLYSDMGRNNEAKEMYEKALKIRENLYQVDPENLAYQSYVAETLNGFGNLLKIMGKVEDAKKRHEHALAIREKLLESNSKKIVNLSNLGETLNDLGNSLYKLGQFKESEDKYKKALRIREDLLKKDSRNLIYISEVGETLNNLGTLLFDMDNIKEAKKRYEQALKICSDSQFLIVGKKAQAIVGVIRSLLELAEIEEYSYQKMSLLKMGVNVCKQNRDFFRKNDLKHEGNLILEAGLRAYLDYLMLDIGRERNPDKLVKVYEKSIKTVKELEDIETEESNRVLLESALHYLLGRQLINESLRFESPDMGLIKEAREQFKLAKETYGKASICYCIYTGILELESIEDIEKESDLKIKSIRKVIEELKKEAPTSVISKVIMAFEDIILLLENKKSKGKEEVRNKLNSHIIKIDSFAVRNIFDHTGNKFLCRLAEYQKEPFSPSIEYRSGKLIIKFTDPEKVKGVLTIVVGERKIFDDPLHGKNEIIITYTPMKKEEKIIFKVTCQKKPVIRSFEFSEYVGPNLKVCILEHNCKENILINSNMLNIAVIQLKYNIIKDSRVIKLTIDESIEEKLSKVWDEENANNFRKEKEAYWKKIRYILEAVKEKAKIVVFPEFSIPFELLPEIQKYADENRIIVVAGSHYVTERNLNKYENLFISDIQSKDLRKNICPIVIPFSKIVHTEKILPAAVERKFLSSEGMIHGDLKCIFNINNNLNVGVLICFEYLDKLRMRFIETCDVLLVPQANPNTERFYQVALEDLNNPPSPGNKAYIMANGIFPFEGKMIGGCSGLLLTLDKNLHKEQIERNIKKPIDGIYEQFILMASINTKFNPARDISQGQVAIGAKWTTIIEENEIFERARFLFDKKASLIKELYGDEPKEQQVSLEKEKNKIKDEAHKLIEILQKIKDCDDESLKQVLENNNYIIKKFSPLMYEENTKDLANLTSMEIKEKCCPVFIPTDY